MNDDTQLDAYYDGKTLTLTVTVSVRLPDGAFHRAPFTPESAESAAHFAINNFHPYWGDLERFEAKVAQEILRGQEAAA